MEILFAPLFSGSSGNCAYIGSEDEGVIVDCGVSATAALNELKTAKINPSAVKAILVTHEHTDHINGVGALARKLNVPIFATRGSHEGMGKRAGKLNPSQIRLINPNEDFYISGINVLPFSIPHDCLEPCGFAFQIGAIKLALATDIGYIKDSWLSLVSGSSLVLLESDYDEDMLIAGGYPYDLKKRILGRKGHLSNEDAGNAAAMLIKTGAKQIILGHLSKNNNFPELAKTTCESILAENGIRAGRDAQISVARREGLSGVFTIRG